MKTQTITGTSHFVNIDYAIAYYRNYGFDERDVRKKVAKREIHIGKPPLRDGETLSINREEGRYFISSK